MSELDDVQTTVGVIDGLRARIAELEAEAERLTTWAERSEQLAVDEGSTRAKAEAALQDADGRIWRAESALAARDRMMQLAYRQAGSPTTEEGAIIGRDEWLADLRARAEEGSEK